MDSWRRSVLLGIPSALSQGAVPGLSELSFFGGKSFLDFMVFLWFDVFPSLGAFLFCILIGWVWGTNNAAEELSQGNPSFYNKFLGLPFGKAKVWGFFIRYICPLAIVMIRLNAILD